MHAPIPKATDRPVGRERLAGAAEHAHLGPFDVDLDDIDPA
jgi:hypothetical protein